MSRVPIDSEPALLKIIVEVKFRPNLTYFSDAFKIASTFEEDFEDWQTSHDPYQALLYSNSTTDLLRINSDGVTIIYENNYSIESLKQRFEKVINSIFNPSNIEEIRRIGVRQVLTYESTAEFDLLATKLASSFTANYSDHTELAIDSVSDFSFVLDGIKNGFKNHIRFGPCTPKEAKARFSPIFKETRTKATKNSVFIDIDVFNDEVGDAEHLMANTNNIIDESLRITKGYSKLVKSKLRDDN